MMYIAIFHSQPQERVTVLNPIVLSSFLPVPLPKLFTSVPFPARITLGTNYGPDRNRRVPNPGAMVHDIGHSIGKIRYLYFIEGFGGKREYSREFATAQGEASRIL